MGGNDAKPDWRQRLATAKAGVTAPAGSPAGTEQHANLNAVAAEVQVEVIEQLIAVIETANASAESLNRSAVRLNWWVAIATFVGTALAVLSVIEPVARLLK